MKSFQKMDEFERAATLPSLTIDETAKCLVGVPLNALKREIEDETLNLIFHIKMRLKRTLEEFVKNKQMERITKYGENIRGPHPVDDNEKFAADIIFAIAYNCTDIDDTPVAISDRCKTAVRNIAANKKNRWMLDHIGGEALAYGQGQFTDNRGKHKSDEEEINTNKLLGITLMLLAQEKHQQNPAKWIRKNNVVYVDHLKELIENFIAQNEISPSGLKASSLRLKLSSALKAIHD